MGTKSDGGGSDQVVSDYERSGLTRREYCDRHGIAITTLGYHQRRRRMNRAAGNLVPVTVTRALPAAPVESGAQRGFALVLSNGRRIESGWNFDEVKLTELIRIAGAV